MLKKFTCWFILGYLVNPVLKLNYLAKDILNKVMDCKLAISVHVHIYIIYITDYENNFIKNHSFLEVGRS